MKIIFNLTDLHELIDQHTYEVFSNVSDRIVRRQQFRIQGKLICNIEPVFCKIQGKVKNETDLQ